MFTGDLVARIFTKHLLWVGGWIDLMTRTRIEVRWPWSDAQKPGQECGDGPWGAYLEVRTPEF